MLQSSLELFKLINLKVFALSSLLCCSHGNSNNSCGLYFSLTPAFLLLGTGASLCGPESHASISKGTVSNNLFFQCH